MNATVNHPLISEKELKKQLDLLAAGTQFVDLQKSCTTDMGIKVFSENDLENYSEKYTQFVNKGKSILKFVPASGAASRMFKHLYNLENFQKNDELIVSFFNNIERFSFYKDLKQKLTTKQYNLAELIKEKSYHIIAEAILSDEGLGYGNTPKGLVLFHRYASKNRTAFEEHLVEGIQYCKNKNNEVHIHFTVSEKYANAIRNHIDTSILKLEKEYNVKFSIKYSHQDPTTNTVSVDLNNSPLKDKNGEFVFRPGGHGSLLKNLNTLDSDIIFIKNIDNVSIESADLTNQNYKKAIAGKLLEVQEYIFSNLRKLLKGDIATEELRVIEKFMSSHFCISFPETYNKLNLNEKMKFLKQLMNRPIRVCGMVKNEGEPGGGPFILKTSSGQSLQIVESSQVNMNDETQVKIWNSSTHFNPVDIICSIKDFNGKKFDLSKFVDPKTAFISEKSNNGVKLKALEWPGLWNGSMANWLTLFIEVPIVTFNPVKTVNDLLKPAHQLPKNE